jgi:2-keto-3-deoxy-L-fuconate dehydrogenase
MTTRLAGKKVLITAAGQGIGRATALAMAAEGAKVIATDINEQILGTLAIESSLIQCRMLDVLDKEAIAAVAKKLGAVDVLFNCAGHVHHGSILECTDEEWDFAFDLNVKAQYRLTKALLPEMLKAGGASIVNMSSVVSSIVGAKDRFAYTASKAAVIGMTKSIATDYATQGIRCNAICPGAVESPSLEERLHAQGDYKEARAGFIARQPMGRIGLPEEIAALAVYLASDESAYMTGQAIAIDGGWSI